MGFEVREMSTVTMRGVRVFVEEQGTGASKTTNNKFLETFEAQEETQRREKVKARTRVSLKGCVGSGHTSSRRRGGRGVGKATRTVSLFLGERERGPVSRCVSVFSSKETLSTLQAELAAERAWLHKWSADAAAVAELEWEQEQEELEERDLSLSARQQALYASLSATRSSPRF